MTTEVFSYLTVVPPTTAKMDLALLNDLRSQCAYLKTKHCSGVPLEGCFFIHPRNAFNKTLSQGSSKQAVYAGVILAVVNPNTIIYHPFDVELKNKELVFTLRDNGPFPLDPAHKFAVKRGDLLDQNQIMPKNGNITTKLFLDPKGILQPFGKRSFSFTIDHPKVQSIMKALKRLEKKAKKGSDSDDEPLSVVHKKRKAGDLKVVSRTSKSKMFTSISSSSVTSTTTFSSSSSSSSSSSTVSSTSLQQVKAPKTVPVPVPVNVFHAQAGKVLPPTAKIIANALSAHLKIMPPDRRDAPLIGVIERLHVLCPAPHFHMGNEVVLFSPKGIFPIVPALSISVEGGTLKINTL